MESDRMRRRADRPARTSKARGFTLIEIIVTLAIVGILSTLGYISYASSVLKSRRADAQASLTTMMQAQERYFTENNTYSTSLSAIGYSTGTVYSSQGYYTMAAAAGGSGSIATSVTLTATPVQSDPSCTTLSIDNTYAQTATGSNTSLCWLQN
jgi:type IV pilus assembly protein PilE